MMPYTVKQLADFAGVSPRTLHYYDEIALLKPTSYGQNRYRYYDKTALLRLQQILFYRELGFRLKEIKEILDQPDFEVSKALRAHKHALQKRVRRLEQLIATVEDTLENLAADGGSTMNAHQIFEGFSEEQQAAYAAEARQRWEPELVDQSMKLWKSYSLEQKQKVLAEGKAVYEDILANMAAGNAPDSPAVQACLVRWHEHMRYFYEPTWAILRGLGQMYATSPDFRANFEQMHPDFPDFLNESIQVYTEGKV